MSRQACVVLATVANQNWQILASRQSKPDIYPQRVPTYSRGHAFGSCFNILHALIRRTRLHSIIFASTGATVVAPLIWIVKE